MMAALGIVEFVLTIALPYGLDSMWNRFVDFAINEFEKHRLFLQLRGMIEKE